MAPKNGRIGSAFAGVGRFWRSLRSQPIAVIGYVSALTLGLTACVVVYAVLDFFFLRPLPFKDADELVTISSVNAEARTTVLGDPVGRRGWEELARSPAFAGVGGWGNRKAYWGYPAEDIVNRWSVTSSLFEVLGLKAALGQLFRSEDDTSPSDVVLVSWDCWQRRLGGRPDVIGQTVTLTDAYAPGALPEVKRILGVLPQGFKLQGEPPEVVFPIGNFAPGVGSFYLIARLSIGVRIETAEAIASTVFDLTGRDTSRQHARVVPLRDALATELRPPAWMLVAAAAVLLAVSALSAAAQLLNEILSRRHEFGVRLSLGADRTAIGIELIVEHVLRSVLATLCSIGLAYVLLRIVIASAPAALLGSARPTFDGRILLWGVCGASIASLLLGLVPVVFGARKASTVSAIGSDHLAPGRLRALKAIATIQLSISLVLLVLATLLGRTLANLASQPMGFDPSNVAVVSFKTSAMPHVTAPKGTWPQFASWTHTEGMLEAVNAISGVVASAAVSSVPFGNGVVTARVRSDSINPELFEVDVQTVTRDYWKVLRIPLVKGRGLESQDRLHDINQKDGWLVVSSALDKRLGGNSVGRYLLSEDGLFRYQIVGVVGDTKYRSLAEAEVPVVYVLSYTYDGVQSLVVKTAGSAERLLPAIVHTLREYDHSVLITQTTTISALVATSVSAERFRASLAIVMGTIALSLATFAMFLLGHRFVEMRRREIAMRLALGARPGHVLQTVMRDIMQILGVGVAIGWPVSYLCARVLQRFFFGVAWVDPASLALESLILIASTVLAALGPARLALLVNPASALRREG